MYLHCKLRCRSLYFLPFLILAAFNFVHLKSKASHPATKMLEGIWLMANKNVKVKISQKDSVFYGHVVWMDIDANKKNFTLGGTIIDQMHYESEDDEFIGGYFYGRGHKLKCKLKLISQDTVAITVSKGPLRKTKYATRSKL